MKLTVALIDNRYLLIGSSATGHIGIIDVHKGERVGEMLKVDNIDIVRDLRMSSDLKHFVQLNADGGFQILRVGDGALLLSGVYVDAEIVVMLPDGRYDAEYEGAQHSWIRFAGSQHLHTLQQFRSEFYRNDLARAVLDGRDVAPPPVSISAPPTLGFGNLHTVSDGGGRASLEISAQSSAGLKELRLYQDGTLTDTVPLSGGKAVQTISFKMLPQARWISAVAIDVRGYSSIPVSTLMQPTEATENTLHLLAVGIDDYAYVNKLQLAKVDAQTIVKAARAAQGRYYDRVEATLLADKDAAPDHILKVLEEKVAAAKVGDTVMLFFAGHGALSGDGRYFMVTPEARVEDLAGTALNWSSVANLLSRSPARVLVVLDACHSGQTGVLLDANNEHAANAIAANVTRTPILVLAASKGRQESLEMPGEGAAYSPKCSLESLRQTATSTTPTRMACSRSANYIGGSRAR